MAKGKILVVEDEEDILELIRFNLGKEGYDALGVATGEAALKAARDAKPDLVLLDLMLPGIDGLEVCRELKKDPRTESIPVVMLTAKGEEADIVTGLELGADDYITKPFSPRILLARIKAVLRRKAQQGRDEKSIVRLKDLVIDPRRHEVTVAGKPVRLTLSEFKILTMS